MIALAFLVGAATLVVVVGLYLRWLATLPRTVCPSCGEATTSVSHPFWVGAERWVRRRWCTACGWQGWGRNGPVLWPERGPVSHRSGFRWGPERLPVDFGFRFRPPLETGTITGPPAHPSGFRWAVREPASGSVPSVGPAHPSGFRWSARA